MKKAERNPKYLESKARGNYNYNCFRNTNNRNLY